MDMSTPTRKCDFFVGRRNDWRIGHGTRGYRAKFIRDNLFLRTPLITVDFVYVSLASAAEMIIRS